MRFLIDAQLPPALAHFLVSRGHEASHVAERSLENAVDSAVWDLAIELHAVIITKDEDFVYLRTMRPEGPPVVWVRLGNATNKALLTWFDPLFPSLIQSLESGEKLVELV